jgi:bifunctional non-homologous end joining protein LigD
MNFQPAIPTRVSKVPAGPEWLHEIKYDGFRLIVHRDGNRVRLLTRNGFDWNGRYPWIGESALKKRNRQFVIDGEVVVLGVNGVSDYRIPGASVGQPLGEMSFSLGGSPASILCRKSNRC